VNSLDGISQGSLTSKWLASPPKWSIALALGVICALTFAFRCLHLLRDDHYYIVSADSHYFHRMAELLALDETYFYPTHGSTLPIAMFSGITYPLALLARGIAFVTAETPLTALEMVSKFLPPVLGVITVLVLYFGVSRLYGRSVALLSAFLWGIVAWALVQQAAGYLDRDCLSMLLVILGVFLFLLLTRMTMVWHGHNLTWLAAAIAAIAIEALLYVEWGFLGPAILLAALVGFFLAQILTVLFDRIMPALLAEDNVMDWPMIAFRKLPQALRFALKVSSSKPMAVVLGLNLAAIAFRPSILRSMWNLLTDVMGGALSGGTTVAELQGLTTQDILSLGLVLIPIAVGLYVAVKRRHEADLLFLAWFSVLFVAGLFSRRLFLYSVPAMSVVASLGLVAMLDIRDLRFSSSILQMSLVYPRAVLPQLGAVLRVGCGFVVLLTTIAISTFFAYSFASTPPVAQDNQWHAALTWLRQETPEEAVIMTWWDYGYWILDTSHRTPVVDNGVHPEPADRDIARVYTTTDDSEAAAIMMEYGASYLVFSKVELRILPAIAERTGLAVTEGDPESVPPELEDSLYNRSFSDDFSSDYGLERVYSSDEDGEPSLVILALQ
jgi:asparagine N-glycosylation enzyme membrane subunit Stt3